jgi:HK97 family phage portal protein
MSPTDYQRRSSFSSLENPNVRISQTGEELFQLLGFAGGSVALPPITIERALEIPAAAQAINFLSRSLASVPFHAFRKSDGEPQRTDGDVQMLLNEAPNPEWSSFEWRRYMWQQVFTVGRGCTWIERKGIRPSALWPMDPDQTLVLRRGGRKLYQFEGREYPATDVIDVTWALKRNQVDVYSPVYRNAQTLGLAIAMGDFAANFFGSGGMPPLSLEGPLPQGNDAFKRAQADIQRAVRQAKESGAPFFGMPPGHALKPIGIDPDKGQMTEARLFQIQEIARIWGLPPVFVGDLSTGTFSNTEQQDLQLVKHCLGHWVKALEDECNLKLFGQRRRAEFVEHNLDAVLRGDLKSRLEALARGIQTAQLTPDEARALENRPPKPNGDKLYIQGATVPLGTQPLAKAPTDAANDDDQANGADGGDKSDSGGKSDAGTDATD